MAIRILHIIYSLARANGVLGAVMSYYRNIDREQFQFDILYFEGGDNHYKEEIESLGGRCIKCERPSSRNIFALRRAWHQLFMQNSYSILHCHVAQIGVVLFPIAYRYSVKGIILHAHNSKSSEIRYKQIFNSVLNRLSSTMASHHFACSQGAAEALFTSREINRGLFVMNNAVDVARFAFSREKRASLRAELAISDDRVVIGNIGRCCRQKNQLFLIDIFSAYLERDSNALLLIAGDGALLAVLKARAEALNISSSVLFLGVREDVDRVVSAIDLMVMPSLFEGLPVVGIEAQASGVPAIFSSTVTEDVKVCGNVSFLPLESSPQEWSLAIESALKLGREADPEPLITAAGFNIKEESSKLESIYREIISKSR